MSRALKGSLWTVFAVLLALSGVRLLFGCALTVPDFLRLRFCPAPVDLSAIEQEKARREALEQRIRQAEIALARIAPCATCTPGASTSLQSEFALLLDMSGSMSEAAKPPGGQPVPPGAASKFDIVKRDLPPAIEEFGDRPVYFMEFRSCTGARAVNRRPGREVAQAIRNLPVPEGRGSPMASVLREVASVFQAGPDGKYFGNILIVTDTAEECDEKPCEAAREIATQKPGLAINVVDLENSEVLRCLATATGGRFFARGSQVDLRQMINEAKTFPGTGCPPDATPSPPRRT